MYSRLSPGSTFASIHPPTYPHPPTRPLQRCQASCEDEVRDVQAKAGGGKPDPAQQSKLQGVYDKCVGKCVDTHIPLVGAMESKLAGECKKRL